MNNLNLVDVLTCRRVMDYQGICIEYTTGLDEVYVRAQDCYTVMVNSKVDNFGYVQSLDDLAFLLKKHKCLGKSLLLFDDAIIADYLYENNINVNVMIKLCEKLKCNKFNCFKLEQLWNKLLIFSTLVVSKFEIFKLPNDLHP